MTELPEGNSGLVLYEMENEQTEKRQALAALHRYYIRKGVAGAFVLERS